MNAEKQIRKAKSLRRQQQVRSTQGKSITTVHFNVQLLEDIDMANEHGFALNRSEAINLILENFFTRRLTWEICHAWSYANIEMPLDNKLFYHLEKSNKDTFMLSFCTEQETISLGDFSTKELAQEYAEWHLKLLGSGLVIPIEG